MTQRTWSGQDAECAWHWNHETYQKLGEVIFLLSTGLAANRTQAYNLFIELKRWFVEDEFDEYINKLDTHRKSLGMRPLKNIINDIYKERSPQTGWQAKPGEPIPDVMPPLDTIVPPAEQRPNGVYKSTPVIHKTIPAPAPAPRAKRETTEQLSLF